MENNHKIKLYNLDMSSGWVIALIDGCNFENKLEQSNSRQRAEYQFNQICPESQIRVCEMLQIVNPNEQNFDSFWEKISEILNESW